MKALIVLGLLVGACSPSASTIAPTSSVSATASASPTLSPEQLQLLDFIRAYAAVRSDYLSGQPKLPGSFKADVAASVYRQRWNFTNGIAARILSLPRTPTTRVFIEDAEAATLVQASSESIWMNVWEGNYSPAGETADLAKANEQGATASRLWRELDDRIEDALTRVGLDWSPVGGRPPAWRASLQ